MSTMSIKELTPKLKKFIFSNTLVVTVGILIGSFFSYLLQFILGRLLSVSDYGTFNALLSLTYLVGVPAGVFGTSIIKVSSELLAKKRVDTLSSLFWKLNLYAVYIGVTLFILLYFLRSSITSYLNISEINLIFPFSIFLGISYLSIVPSSYLQGLMRFKAYAFYVSLNSFLRMLIPALLVYFGFRVFGVFYGFTIGIILSFIVSTLLLKKNLYSLSELQELDLTANYKKILSFSFSVIFINFGLMALNNLDVLMVKRFFDPDIAGYYAGTVTLGKIFLFGAGTVATVMFPQISHLYAKKSKALYSKFKKFISIQLLFIVCGLVAFFVFPKLLTVLFFGDRFIHSVEYLPHFSIFIALYILINFMVLFFMAIEKTKVFLALIVTVIAQYLLFNYYHGSINGIININIVVATALLVSLSLYFLRVRKQFVF